MAQAASAEMGSRSSFSFFRTDNVSAQVMGPRLLVVVSVTILTLIGILMVFSASSIEAITNDQSIMYYVVRQFIFAILGVAAAFCIVRFIPDYGVLVKIGWVYYVLCMVLLVATAAFGVVGLGAQRWITIGGFTLQPSEFAKVAIIGVSAYLVQKFRNGEYALFGVSWRFVMLVGLPLALIFRAQSDLGSTIIILVGILAILWMSGFPRSFMVGLLVIGIVFIAISSSSGYRSDRWIFLNPWQDPYGSGFQVIHSFYAFAQGGLFGKGLGNSAEKYQYLPEAETDFIFSIIGEELGLLGAFAVVLLFAALFYGGVRIAQASPEPMGKALCYGLVTMIVFQAFLNMGMCLGLAPTTGKPLPFVSSGGSSLIASLIIVGLLLFVSRNSDDSVYEKRRRNLEILHSVEDGCAGRPAKAPTDGRLFGRAGKEEPAPRRNLPRDGRQAGGGRFRPGDSRDSHAGTQRDRGGSTREHAGAQRNRDRSDQGRSHSDRNRSRQDQGRNRAGQGRGRQDQDRGRTERCTSRSEGARRDTGRSGSGSTRSWERSSGRPRNSTDTDSARRSSSGSNRNLNIVDNYDVPNRGRSSRGNSPDGRSPRRK